MKFTTRDVCLVIGGVAVGTLVGGAVVIYKAITSKTIGPAISKALAEKMVDSMLEKPRYVSYNRSKQVSYRRPNNVSYKSYYDRKREFDTDVIFGTRKDADEAVSDMLKILKAYGQVTVNDLYCIAGLTNDPKAEEYGWTIVEHIAKAPIGRVRNGWIIDLPKPTELD